MRKKLVSSPLFFGMNICDIEHCLKCSGATIVKYEKEQHVFMLQETPNKLFILVEGAVHICHDSLEGKRNIITTINKSGDLFGEVFLFMDHGKYENYAVAATDATVLKMPKEYLYNQCPKNCGFHSLLISNMLSILANKAYYLNQKLNIISSQTLRQKISKFLIKTCSSEGEVSMNMSREELADYLNVARPSLSRELMKMQEDGLIEIKKKKILMKDLKKIQKLF